MRWSHRAYRGLFRALQTRLALLWVGFAAVTVFAAFGVLRLEFDDGLVRVFESNLDRYQRYTTYRDEFESDANDVFVLFEGADFAAPRPLNAISDFLLDAQFVDGVRAALSPLSLQITGDDGSAELLIPYPPPPHDIMAQRLDQAWQESANLRRLMSSDRQTLLAVLPLQGVVDDIAARRATVDALRGLAATSAAAADISVTLTGYPVLRDRMAKSLFEDLLLLIIVGTVVGLVVATLTLRSVVLGLLTALAPATSVLWVLGTLGHLGVTINVITITLPVLVLVLATSDALHISIEVTRQQRRNSVRATLRGIRRVAPACILAAVTTAVAFGALTLSRSTLITELGQSGGIATLLSVASVLVTQTLVLSTAGRLVGFDRLFSGQRGTPARLFSLRALPAFATRAPRRVAAGALGVLVTATALYLTVEPNYSLFDNLAADDPTLQSLRRLESRVAPTAALHFTFPVAADDSVARVHQAVVRHAGSDQVLSLDSLKVPGQTVQDVLRDLPEPLARRLATPDGDKAVVSLLFSYANAEQTRALVEKLEPALAADPALAGLDLGPATGLPVMSSYVSHAVLRELNYSFLVAILASAALVALWLRSLRIALIALVPNVLPVSLIGAWMALSGGGLEFAGGLALTVTFGIAVDDTIHVLNRLRLSGAIRHTTPAAIAVAMREVAPALVITSLVLTLGMSGTLFTTTPSVVDFGLFSMAVFVLALFADLMVLPACLAVFGPRPYFETGGSGDAT